MTGTDDREARVLVVDDDVALGRSLGRFLRDYEVVLLDNAKGALARVAAGERFDIVFCDLMMPEMTGMDLYEQIRQVAPDQAERMVFMTGGVTTKRARDFVATVRNPVLDKPFDIEVLREMIQRRLDAEGPQPPRQCRERTVWRLSQSVWHPERMAKKSRRGFAAMDPEKQKAIASMGGQAAHASGRAHEFTPEEARSAGTKGGHSVARDREHMAAIGRLGGKERGRRRRARVEASR